MLHTFISENREEIIRRCRAKVEARSIPPPTPAELEYGVPTFLDQLVESLVTDASHSGSPADIDASAARHGRDLQMQGFTVSQVVHDYGDVCQAITDLAVDTGAAISADDFRVLNRCLDDAIASAVTAHSRQSTESRQRDDEQREDERYGFFAHESRNLVQAATLAFGALETGNVGVLGSTGMVLKRSLTALAALIDRSVTDIRLRRSLQDRRPLVLAEVINEIAPAASLEAADRGLRFAVDASGASDAVVRADRPILTAIVVNLLQNAFKFTRPGTGVTLTVSASTDRVSVAVADECGGLPDDVEGLFRPFAQGGTDRTGLGLGLALSRMSAQAHDGQIRARSVPGHGCVFTLDLPRIPVRLAAGGTMVM